MGTPGFYCRVRFQVTIGVVVRFLAGAVACVALVLVVGTRAEALDPYPIVFPVVGENEFDDTFGDPRGTDRTHEGVDIMAEKMVPVVAAASGTVGWMHDEQGGNCCAMQLIHDDGYASWYIHLNNDTPGTDDGQGWGFAPGIDTGVHVSAGALIGYVGDSGNAEEAPPHLHFELRDPSGVAFDPYPSLLVATYLDPATADEVFFYSSTSGTFSYYDIGAAAVLGSPRNSGTFSLGWDSITAVDLDGDGRDEQFFYRSADGVFKYYDVKSNGTLGTLLQAGVYSTGWDSITAVDLDGDDQDELFFYRSSDGVFKYYDVKPNGALGAPLQSGLYSLGWDSITAVDIDGDSHDEQLFYRSSDGVFKYYRTKSNGALGALVNSGKYSLGWSSITAIDLEGDGFDEQLFYRSSDGVFKYYDLKTNGSLGALLNSGIYSTGWTTITAINLD